MALQSSSLGRFWLGPQTARGSAASTYHGFKANMIDAAPGQMFRNIGQLVGGSLLPGGSIKTAAWSGGSLVLPPPLEEYIGWLLYAFAGSVSSMDNGDSTYSHFFPATADSTAPNLYLTARRSVPGTNTTLYEQMADMRPVRMQMGFTPGEFSTMNFQMVGRTPTNPDGSGWTFTAEDETSVPITAAGAFELPDGTEVVTASAMTLDITNIVPPMQQVLVVGDYYPYDFPVLGRNITISFSYLWDDPDLYQSLYYSGTAWTPTVYSSSVDMYVQSPTNITGASVPHELRFYAPNVDWTCQPVALQGGGLVQMAMQGIVADASSGFDWYLMLRNGKDEYAWPS